MSEPVRYELVNGVATITMDNPEARNRLTVDGMRLLQRHLETAAADETVRVVVLTGSGNTFCAGADLANATAGGGFADGLQALATLLTTMLDHPKPIISRVQGHVAGGGNGLIAASDISIAVEEAKFAFSEVRVGAAPAVISVVCLMRMNRIDASELLLTGERVSAERVVKAGLVTRAVETDALDATVRSYVDSFVQCGPIALANTKKLIRNVPYMGIDEAFTWTTELSAGLFSSPEAQEGMSAFLAKRPAAWVPQT